MGMGAPAAAAASLAPAVANTDSSFSNLVDLQAGHAGCVPLRTSVSNSRLQSWQAYSYIGMGVSPEAARA
jgi:hypothetical protein